MLIYDVTAKSHSDSWQSAYDTDATYRDKARKKASGYTATFTETCTDENIVQIIVDYTVEPNNNSDVEIIDNRMDIIKDTTGASDIYVDGGYWIRYNLRVPKTAPKLREKYTREVVYFF